MGSVGFLFHRALRRARVFRGWAGAYSVLDPPGRFWWQRPVRVVQFNVEDRYGVYVPRISGRRLAELAEDLHANVIVVFARDPWGRLFYRGSSLGPVHGKMRGDLVRELVEEAGKRGIRVVLMVGHTANKFLYKLHGDWAQVNRHGEVIMLEHVPANEKEYEPEWPILCINSPFIDHVKREVAEALGLKASGVLLDSFRYQPDPDKSCYCRWCRDLFRREYGYDMPVEPRWSDSRWKDLWDWRYRVVARRLKEIKEVIRNVGGVGTPLIYNSHPGGWGGRNNRVVEESRESIDVVMVESSEADREPPGFISEMSKLSRAVSGGKPVWSTRNYFHMYRTTTATTPVAIRQGLREAIVAGASPWLLVFSSSYIQDPSGLEAARKVFEEHEKLEELLDGAEPVRYAAIVYSTKTLDHYGRSQPQHYVDEVRGFYYALQHSHVPVEYVSARDIRLEVLQKYRVVILANTVCLSDESSREIMEYVRKGGGLVATYLASTWDCNCVERYEPSVAPALGVTLKGLLRLDWSYLVIGDFKHPVTRSVGKRIIPWGDMDYSFYNTRTSPELGWHTLIEPYAGTSTVAYIGLTEFPWGDEYTLGRSPPPISRETKASAVVVNRFGEGKTVYFTGQLGRHYWRLGLPEYQALIKGSVTYVGGPLPVVVDAPSTVQAEPWRQGDRIILHLLNHTYNQRILNRGLGDARQPVAAFGSHEAVHPPVEVIPVHDVRIRLDLEALGLGYEAYSAWLPLSPDSKIEPLVRDGVLELRVGRLDEYAVIVVEPRR